MRVWEIRGGFGLENLVRGERPEPEAGPGEVLLAMRAASLNYRDLLMVQGLYNPRQPLPLVPCSDGVGEVVAVGTGVDRIAVGDRVAPIFAQGWLAGRPDWRYVRTTLGGPLDGTLAERMVVPATAVVAVPEHLSDAEAASLPCAAVTAWHALADGGVGPGDTVLTLGTGGVSLFAVQIARLFGARVFVTSSSQEKLDRVTEELGAAAGVDYQRQPEWAEAVRELAGGSGVDHVVEVGGAGTLEQSLRAVRPGGTISLIGNLAGNTTEIDVRRVLMRGIRIQGVFIGHREHFEELARAFALHRVRPVVDRTFGFDEAPAAFERMARGGHFGKITIEIGG